MVRRLIYTTVTVLLTAVALAGETPQTQTLPLKWVVLAEEPEGVWGRAIELKDNRFGEMDFPMPSGKLRFQVEADDSVRIDRNDDGVCDDQDKPLARSGRPTSVTVRIGNEPVNYRLVLTPYRQQPNRRTDKVLHVLNLTALEVVLGKSRLRLLDANVNGHFGDLGQDEDDGDKVQIGDEAVRPLQRRLFCDGRFLDIEVQAQQPALRVTPYTGPLATLAFSVKPGFEVTASIRHKDSGYSFEAKSGQPAVSYPGTHQVVHLTLCSSTPPVQVKHKMDDDTAMEASQPSLLLQGGDLPDLQLKEGLNEQSFGPPLKLEFSVVRSPKDPTRLEIQDLWLVGTGGERYRADNCGEASQTSLQSLLRDGAKTEDLSKMSYG